MSLEGKAALVTGSTSGIGLAIARAFAAEGCKVMLNGLGDRDAIHSLRDDIAGNAGVEVAYHGADMSKPAEIADLVAETRAKLGGVDILVNNAGIQRRGPLDTFPPETWHEVMRTNLDSVFYVGQQVAQRMIARGRGKIINVCSVQSELGRPSIAPYAASKGAVKMLTKGMAIDWGQHGIQVNGLGPGYFKTELTDALVKNAEFTQWLVGRTPSRRWGDVEDLVGAAVFLASDASNFVNGHILYVDGGVTATL
jgi:gluconate 5-dehydrogenase